MLLAIREVRHFMKYKDKLEGQFASNNTHAVFVEGKGVISFLISVRFRLFRTFTRLFSYFYRLTASY